MPLKLTFPDADMPTIQLSLLEGLDPERHLALGRALAPLRDEDVLLVGSGMSFHNMRDFVGGAPREARAARSAPFDDWLRAGGRRGCRRRATPRSRAGRRRRARASRTRARSTCCR